MATATRLGEAKNLKTAVEPNTVISKHDMGWRRVVRNFTPSWFSVNMGTGIASILLNTLPYNGQWLYYISIILFVLNLSLFFLFCTLTIARYVLYPRIFVAMIRHPVQSMFIGTFPMGFATIINMFVFICVPLWGEWTKNFAWAMWIFDAVVSVFTAFTLPALLMMHMKEMDLSSMTAVWLLPIVSPIVAAASGAVVADILPDPRHAFWTVIASYVLWGVGLPMALMVTTIYLQRLTLHKLPPKALIVSVFLPLGPLGQGGYAIQKLGLLAQSLFPKTQSSHALPSAAGDIFCALGFITALILWGFGLIWLFFALTSIAYTRKFPFNIGWWGFTFPLGVFATSTCQIGRELESSFFLVLGTILSVVVTMLWVIVTARTILGAVEGKVFHAPCLGDMQPIIRAETKGV
ncbi:putative MFS transporter [Talaromyces proteolyticus]|uniref:Sulfite efflux pump SSU1 n=1 Tax=Talaromyces proteolyticus TaxID=1131652 RepID=A0AAD4PU83_9EURO|nr:putative MFS transporter [Talaromyces proteolyticus]KAH8691960.1 putative MFS transporter [Talaromyces proteolyticus]